MIKWFFNRHRLSTFIRERIPLIETGQILTKQGSRFTYSGIHRLKDALFHLEAFEKASKKIYVHEMNDAWFQNFLSFLSQRNIKRNTVHGTINQIKTNLRRACRTYKIPYMVEEFTYSPEVTTQVYNTIAELKALAALKLKGVQRDTRDAYVIQSFTGLRRSDLVMLLQDINQYTVEQDGKKYFRIRTQKTDKVVVIPIANTVMEILESRDWKIKTYSIQSYNKNIKKIAKKAGLAQNIEVFFTRNAKKIREIHPKYALMSSHTARRSFATNAFLAGIPTLKIRQITGHSTEAIFLVYIRADGMDSASTIVNDPFFLT
ncbi:hypothetical protein DTQ70_04375 [Runella sp. SP2]|nr:hypothetical protein DTQ70_04375 [Runella sp. SP2]